MTTMPDTTSPLPFEIGDAAAHVGAERDVADVAHAHGHAAVVAREHDAPDVGGRIFA